MCLSGAHVFRRIGFHFSYLSNPTKVSFPMILKLLSSRMSFLSCLRSCNSPSGMELMKLEDRSRVSRLPRFNQIDSIEIKLNVNKEML